MLVHYMKNIKNNPAGDNASISEQRSGLTFIIARVFLLWTQEFIY